MYALWDTTFLSEFAVNMKVKLKFKVTIFPVEELWAHIRNNLQLFFTYYDIFFFFKGKLFSYAFCLEYIFWLRNSIKVACHNIIYHLTM